MPRLYLPHIPFVGRLRPNLAGRILIPLVACAALTLHYCVAREPKRSILFVTYADAKGSNPHMVTGFTDGTGVRALPISKGSVFAPRYSPSGRWIAFMRKLRSS